MHKIERYGVIALLFLAVTVFAVVLWDDEPTRPPHPAGPDSGRAQPLADVRSTTDPRLASNVPRIAANPFAGPTLDSGPVPADRRSAEGQAPTRPLNESGAIVSTGIAPPLDGDAVEELLGADQDAGLLESAPGRTSGARHGGEAPPAADPARGEAASRVTTASEPARGPVLEPDGTYVVKPGDTLGAIASEVLGTSTRWREIAELNGVDPTRLMVGARLRVPGRGSAATPSETAPAPKPAPSETAAGGATYVVASGDTLSGIAAARLGDSKRWREIVKLNPGIDPNRLVVGKRLVLPAGAKASTPRSESSEPRIAAAGANAPAKTSRRKVR